MKNDEIGALRRDVITEASLKGVLLLAVVAFVCVFSLGRQTWPTVFFGIVLLFYWDRSFEGSLGPDV